ncbi:hypothetical protein HK098_008204 [Nowakowskiella sp. JEL0407]|nr:hypothetical protein HK098_008204 [Nowakowskiella sp. JEL0407]
MKLLNYDKSLQRMRFNLVPKSISDADFWRNYFYRIHLLKSLQNPQDSTEIYFSSSHELNDSNSTLIDEPEQVKIVDKAKELRSSVSSGFSTMYKYATNAINSRVNLSKKDENVLFDIDGMLKSEDLDANDQNITEIVEGDDWEQRFNEEMKSIE